MGDEVVDTVRLKALGTVDALLDLMRPQASKSTHLRSVTSALRRGGRVSLMGFVEQPFVPWTCVGMKLVLKGKFMYERSDIVQMVKMLEQVLFPRGEAFVDTEMFGLEDWKDALDRAGVHTGIGRQVVLSHRRGKVKYYCHVSRFIRD